MPLSRRQFIIDSIIAIAGLGVGLKTSGEVWAQIETYATPEDYWNSREVIFENEYNLLCGYRDWGVETLLAPNNIANTTPQNLTNIGEINEELPNYILELIDWINFDNSHLVEAFLQLPEYLYGDPSLYSNLPEPGQIRLINAGDSTNSVMYNQRDMHVVTFHRVPGVLYDLESDHRFRRVLSLFDPNQIIPIEDLQDPDSATELEYGVGINRTYRNLVNDGLLNDIFEENPNIVLFTVGKMDAIPLTPEENFDPGELYINARNAILACLSRDPLVIPIIMLPNILDADMEGHFVANPKGLAICLILHRLAVEFDIPFINQYPSFRNIGATEVTTRETRKIVGAYGTGFVYLNDVQFDAQHYSRAGSDPNNIDARLNMDTYYSTRRNFPDLYGHSGVTKVQLEFFANAIEQGMFVF